MNSHHQQLMHWQAMRLGPRYVRRQQPLPAEWASAQGDSDATVQISHSPTPHSALPLSHKLRSTALPDASTLAGIWPELASEVAACQACGLCQSRRQTVFSAGVVGSPVMVVGEAPGAEEDAQGEPFVGQAGRLLDQMLASIDLSRERNVLIANVLKCRPPGNRNPEPEEVAQCLPFLHQQIKIARPQVLFLLGRFATEALLAGQLGASVKEIKLGSLRGKVYPIQLGDWQGQAVVSYHPAYLLRSPADKLKAWQDLCLLNSLLSATPHDAS